MNRFDDYRCNYACNQGRNCPARTAPFVQKEGGRFVDTELQDQPMPPAESIAFWGLIVVALFVSVALLGIALGFAWHHF